jgi:hypothetical protein
LNADYDRRALGCWIVAALVLDIAGAQHVYTQQTVAAAALAALGLVWLLGGALFNSGEPLRSLALLPVAGLVPAMIDVATFVPPDGGWSPLRLAILWGGGLTLLATIRLGAAAVVAVALLLGTAIRMIHLRHIPITPPNGDMLPLVQGALDNLLAGRSPYTTYQMPWDVPLTYLPITWLSYLPAYLLRLDLRWTNIAAEIVILLALAWLSAQRGGWRATLRNGWLLTLWAWLFLQPSVIHWDAGNTAPITWALLAVTFALVLAGRDRTGALALGLTAAASPLITVFAPFVGLYWLRARGIVATARLVAGSMIVAAVFVLPFVLWAPGDFINGTYRWFNTLDGWPLQKWRETDPPVWGIITGFSGEFWQRGTQAWLKPIQALIVGGVLGLYWWRGAPREQLAPHAAVAYLGFMLFNPVLWPYLYNPAIVVGLVGLAAVIAPRSLSATAPVSAHKAHGPWSMDHRIIEHRPES